MRLSPDIRQTLELLAEDEAASETERAHARRLLATSTESLGRTPTKDVEWRDITLTGDDWEVGQKAARISAAIWRMPLVLYHSDSGYQLMGDPGTVRVVAQSIEDIQGLEDAEWGPRMRVAWMGRALDLLYHADGSDVVGGDYLATATEELRRMGLPADSVHPRVVRDYKRHSDRASRLAADLLS